MSSGQLVSIAPSIPSHNSTAATNRQRIIASSTLPAANPERMKSQPVRRIVWRTSKATMLVFSPLELVRSVTVSTICGAPPFFAA